jgi:hypothetical protein
MNRGIADSPPTPSHALRLSAELSGGGELVVVRTAAGQICEFPLGENPYEGWRRWLRNQLRGSGQAGRRSRFRDKAGEVAQELARQMDVAELGRQLEAADSSLATTALLRVELADWELDLIPWELLALPVAEHLGGRDVCVYRAVPPKRRKVDVTPPDPPQRVLLVDSSPLSKQSVNFKDEYEAIRERLLAMKAAGLVQLDPCREADSGKLSAEMERPVRAVHLAAQGEPGQVSLRQGTEDVGFPSKPFAQIFSHRPQPVAVVLSVCDSARGTPESPAVARALAAAGVPEVLGMYSVITPQAALEFFKSLYEALGRCSDMVTAYAKAVAELREDDFPNCGFWSVPVLYSRDNVIPFPATRGDPKRAYQQIAHEVAQLHADLADLRPEESWNENAWRRETMDLRIGADDTRLELQQLITLIQPEARSGSKWAEDVGRAALAGLHAFNGIVTYASHPLPGGGSVPGFDQCKAELVAVLEELHEAISARLAFCR